MKSRFKLDPVRVTPIATQHVRRTRPPEASGVRARPPEPCGGWRPPECGRDAARPQDRLRRTEMRRSYRSGFRTALRRWPLALLLFAATCVPGLVFSAAAWSWLADALDKSLATRTLLTDLDMNVFVDLIGHHGESLRMLLLGGLLLAVVCWLFGVWLNAMTISAVGDDLPLAAAAHRGLDLYVTFLALDLLALVVDGSC